MARNKVIYACTSKAIRLGIRLFQRMKNAKRFQIINGGWAIDFISGDRNSFHFAQMSARPSCRCLPCFDSSTLIHLAPRERHQNFPTLPGCWVAPLLTKMSREIPQPRRSSFALFTLFRPIPVFSLLLLHEASINRMSSEEKKEVRDPRLEWLGVRVATACRINKAKVWDQKVSLADEYRY